MARLLVLVADSCLEKPDAKQMFELMSVHLRKPDTNTQKKIHQLLR